MTMHSILIFKEGAFEIPLEVKAHFQLTEGARLRLTFTSESAATLERDSSLEPATHGWRAFRGFLKDSPAHEMNEVRATERAWELAHDERKYGLTRS